MKDQDFEVIDEVPTKDDIMAAIGGKQSFKNGDTVKATVTATVNDAENRIELKEQHSVNDVKKSPEKLKNEEIRITAPQKKQDPEAAKNVVQPSIIRDAKGRITQPIPQKTNKNGKAGRKPAINDDVLEVLRQAFLTGATDEEAAEFADISVATLYRYQEKNPEFCEEKEAWKTNPVMKARVTVYNSLNDPRIAAWYLERKKKDEFSTRTEHTGKGGEDLPPVRIEYVTPTDAIRVNKDSLRSDLQTASSVAATTGSDDE